MSKKEEKKMQSKNLMHMLSKPSFPVEIKLGLEDPDKEILRGILTQLQKMNDTLDQILNYLRKNK